MQNIHYLELNTSNYDDLYKWCDGHPSAVADRAIAQQLAAFIESIVPSWSNASAISLTVDQASLCTTLSLMCGGHSQSELSSSNVEQVKG